MQQRDKFLEKMKFDVRLKNWNYGRAVTTDERQNFISSLSDLSSQAKSMELEKRKNIPARDPSTPIG